MSPTILYLHGIGDRVRSARWLVALDGALAEHGLAPRRPGVDLLVPDYTDVLRRGLEEDAPVPDADVPVTYDPDAAALARPAYMRERARLALDLGLHDRHREPRALPVPLYETGRRTWTVLSPGFRHVERYRRHRALRHQVLHRVHQRVQEVDEVVVVAHSLGSLVAIDLLTHLPPHLRVRRLVTVGSPAGWPSLHRGARSEETFPYDRVGSWVDLHSLSDLVPLGRGTHRLYPAAIDVVVPLPALRHGAELYLGLPVTGRVLADALRPGGPEPSAPPDTLRA